jgi:glutaredoxin 3
MKTNLQAEVWSQPNCPACTEAKKLLLNKGYEILTREIGFNTGFSKKDLFDKVPNARTIPQIFIGEQYVGGLTELKKYLIEHDNNKTIKVV